MLQDYKLALRMLLKYPGLTIAGGLALAVAIGIGAGWYDLTGKLMAPVIPLPEGHRIVTIETQNTLTNAPEPRVVRDFLEWRRELRTIEDLGAYREDTRNLIIGSAAPELIHIAELTAAAFRTARVPPLLGRGLLDSDEMPGAPGVIVLGYGVWQRSFGGRRDVIGSAVKLGNTSATVIGVMPDGFGYPINHEAWTPLLLGTSYEALEGGAIGVVGRLAPGVTQDQANAELRVLAERTAAALPATHAHLRPRVMRLGEGFRDTGRHRAVRDAEHACAAGAPHRVHERRHADLREDGDTRGGNRRAFGARRKPRAHRRAALRGSPRARIGRSCARSRRRRSGDGVGDRQLRRRAVLDHAGPEAHDHRVCECPRGHQRCHAVAHARAESHARGAIAPPEPGRRRRLAELRPRLDGRDDRAGRADGHRHSGRHGERDRGDAQPEHPRGVSKPRLSRRPHRDGPGAHARRARAAHRAGTRRGRSHVRRPRARVRRAITIGRGRVVWRRAGAQSRISTRQRWNRDSSRCSIVPSSPGVRSTTATAVRMPER